VPADGRLRNPAEPSSVRAAMFLMLNKGPRKTDRKRSSRFKAKLKAKNRSRRNRIYQRGK
jgi:hypothetical protein